MSRQTLIINFVFFLALGISLAGISHFLKGTNTHETYNENETPDSYMLNASYMRTNEQGRHEITLFTPILQHYHQDNQSTFLKPRLEIFKKGQHWIITSKRGQGLHGVEMFKLNENVVVEQLPSQGKGGSTLLTEALTVFPKKELVTTNALVTIKQPGLNIQGKGLHGNLKDGNIQLLSQTRGFYDPKRLP